ncbi:MAG: 1-acyl-sn-glycerol-3-phosphate acyltransferase [Bacteroidota bacterium]|uniref:Acyltransferase n=1 Tax=Algoriphagus faecimaris TaxID=686796 RepID=A0A1G6V164_9BACT|nr:1-acyl-sn-glycerol-3-phosphate acyltransferase [Algoriphagus faecimaris]SDD46696.1 Acyltransferase [Algoriphagus faecimaris]
MSKKYIDIEKAIASKNPKLLKWLPGFAISYIKKVTHETWINEVMNKIGHLKGLEFVNAVIEEFGMEVELIGEEKIPLSGGFIVASNHPLGGLDGIALMYAIGRIRPDIRFLVNDLLMAFENFQPIFVPVNKHGKNSFKALDTIDEVFAKDFAVLLFPAGLVSRKSENGIQDLVWKKSFITKAKKYGKEILPCFIKGRNSKFFYNLASWRKKIGVKANIEMFYLADEMYKQKGQKVRIRLGDCIRPEQLDSSKSDLQWAAFVKKKVYELEMENE